ncbi:hypothetical protein JL720_1833 [Aureococcus anophagefferens]|nr:hypothetical protein JL720_1833 [Aureococcus anophagefferens]
MSTEEPVDPETPAVTPKSVIVHPIVVFGILDHYIRRQEARSASSARFWATSTRTGVVERRRRGQNGTALIHDFYSRECAAPVHVVVDASLRDGKGVETAAYHRGRRRRAAPLAAFQRPMPSSLTFSDGEKVCIDRMIRGQGDEPFATADVYTIATDSATTDSIVATMASLTATDMDAALDGFAVSRRGTAAEWSRRRSAPRTPRLDDRAGPRPGQTPVAPYGPGVRRNAPLPDPISRELWIGLASARLNKFAARLGAGLDWPRRVAVVGAAGAFGGSSANQSGNVVWEARQRSPRLEALTAGKTVVELGCGCAVVSVVAAAGAARVVATDASPAVLQRDDARLSDCRRGGVEAALDWERCLGDPAATTRPGPPRSPTSSSRAAPALRAEFPLHQRTNGRDLIYFDSGATSQKPARVLVRAPRARSVGALGVDFLAASGQRCAGPRASASSAAPEVHRGDGPSMAGGGEMIADVFLDDGETTFADPPAR